MTILVSWVNNNSHADQVVRVYRSTKDITKDSLPQEPLVVFDYPASSFFDESAIAGVLYTYIVEIETTNDKVYSNPIRKQVTFDSLWGDGDDVLVSGDPNLFAFGRDITQGSISDGILREMMRMLGADQTYNNFVKIVNKGRYFIVPRLPVSVDFSKMMANNCFLGHREFEFVATTDVSKYGNNDYFIYRGRKWRIGMPSVGLTPVAGASSINSKLNSDTSALNYVDKVRGYPTSTRTAENPEVVNLIVNMYLNPGITTGASAAPKKEPSNSIQTLTSTLLAGTVATPQVLSVSDTQYGTTCNFTTNAYVTTSRMNTAIPHLEYLGVVNA